MSEHHDKKRAHDDDLVDDIKLEPEDEFGDVGAAKAKLAKLRGELKEAQKKRDEYLDGWQRCKADAINMRKDAESSAKRTAELLREALVHDIIPALDSFDMASGSEAWGTVSDGFRSGMEQVQSQLLSALRTHGIERYGKVGDKFEHNLHDAIEENADMPGEHGTIARMLRYGYRAGDRILRAAQVIVKT